MKLFFKFLTILIIILCNTLFAFSQNRAHFILEKLQNPSKKYISVIAHRGNWQYAPENSLEAIKYCINIGVDIVEIDVRMTKDKVLILMHDDTVDRTTNGKGKVEDLTLAQIKALRLRNGVGIKGSLLQVPTLEEVMMLTKDKILVNLDKTEGKIVKECYEVLKKTGTIKQAIFKGFESIEVLKNKYGTLMDSIIYEPLISAKKTPNIDKFISDFEKNINPFIYEMLFESENSPVFKIFPQMYKEHNTVVVIALWDDLCAGHTDEKVIVSGADSAWGWLIENGATVIMTDRSEELLSYLRKKGLHD